MCKHLYTEGNGQCDCAKTFRIPAALGQRNPGTLRYVLFSRRFHPMACAKRCKSRSWNHHGSAHNHDNRTRQIRCSSYPLGCEVMNLSPVHEVDRLSHTTTPRLQPAELQHRDYNLRNYSTETTTCGTTAPRLQPAELQHRDYNLRNYSTETTTWGTTAPRLQPAELQHRDYNLRNYSTETTTCGTTAPRQILIQSPRLRCKVQGAKDRRGKRGQ